MTLIEDTLLEAYSYCATLESATNECHTTFAQAQIWVGILAHQNQPIDNFLNYIKYFNEES